MGQITEQMDKLQDTLGTDYRTNGQIAGYTWDRLQNKWTNCRIHLGQITKQMDKLQRSLKITPILDKLMEYKRSWIRHVNRMP